MLMELLTTSLLFLWEIHMRSYIWMTLTISKSKRSVRNSKTTLISPDRINTEFVKVIDRHTLQMRVWERGSGETLACGTGACAVAVASTLNGLVDEGEPVTVKLLGGNLQIFWNRQENLVYMTGPATTVFDGEIDLSFLK